MNNILQRDEILLDAGTWRGLLILSCTPVWTTLEWWHCAGGRSRRGTHEWGRPWCSPRVSPWPPPCRFHLSPWTSDFQTRTFLWARARIPEFDGHWPRLQNSWHFRKWKYFVIKRIAVDGGSMDQSESSSECLINNVWLMHPLSPSRCNFEETMSPCIFLRWKRGLPRKLFLMLFSLDLQWTEEGEPGGVGSSCSVSEPETIYDQLNHCPAQHGLIVCRTAVWKH